VPWPEYSNPDFSRTLLFFHWTAVLIASTGFLYGFVTRWQLTPKFMLFGYGLMAMICVIETFWYMTGDYKYIAMIIEFAAYFLILLLLHNNHFQEIYFEMKSPSHE
jgi:hypothetical protein